MIWKPIKRIYGRCVKCGKKSKDGFDYCSVCIKDISEMILSSTGESLSKIVIMVSSNSWISKIIMWFKKGKNRKKEEKETEENLGKIGSLY